MERFFEKSGFLGGFRPPTTSEYPLKEKFCSPRQVFTVMNRNYQSRYHPLSLGDLENSAEDDKSEKKESLQIDDLKF